MGGGRRRILALLAAVMAAAVVAAVLILLSGPGQEKGQPTTTPRAAIPGQEKGQPATTPRAAIPASGNVLGLADAPVTIVEFSDFQCPFCREFARGAKQRLTEEYIRAGKVKLVYRHFAFLGPESQMAAEASECAREQDRFWDYHDMLFANQGRENSGAFAKDKLLGFAQQLSLEMGAFTSCLEGGKYRQKLLEDLQEGQRMGVRGTPAFFIGSQKMEGNQPYERFRTAIEAALAR